MCGTGECMAAVANLKLNSVSFSPTYMRTNNCADYSFAYVRVKKSLEKRK